MKRYVEELDLFYADLLTDAEYAYPSLRSDFERDRQRISLLSRNRGLSFYMTDLPNLGKHLDRCVARQQYSPPHLPASKPVREGVVVIPKLFRGLYLLLFEQNGRLKEDVDVIAYFFLRQLLYGAKKADAECSEAAVAQAIEAFVDTDLAIPMPDPSWVSPTSESLGRDHRGFALDAKIGSAIRAKLGDERGSKLLRRLDEVASIVVTTLGPYEAQEWSFSHGPGAVSDVASGENRYRFPNWSERLERVFPAGDCAHHDYLSWVDEVLLDRRGSREPSSRLIAVPKSLTKPRLIAVEPSEMMFCQQNIRQYIYERFASTWLSKFVLFDDQRQNQEMALRASEDGSLATIDLSEASDRVSCQVVGNLMRANMPLLEALAATRTRFCEVPLRDAQRELVELHKYSTMGNATTFPVQSLVFLCVALACCAEEERIVNPRILKTYQGKVSIFGDDIIVPTKIAGTVCDLLEAMGFKVNTAKSYLEGLFRESCGVDAYRGTCVTPAYWHGAFDGTPESYSSCIETSNNFLKKFLVTTAFGIERRMNGAIRFPTVPINSGVCGFESFTVPPTRFPSRWNQALQREEWRVPVLAQRLETKPVHDNTGLMQYFTEDPSPMDPWKCGIRLRPVTKIRHRWVPTTQFLAERA
jgi:hypothetical protein